MKILNLYAGIGGNRKLWKDVEVTAVEYNEEIAAIYQDHFPGDKVIVADAHEYLLKHYKDFDFIWLSPPRPSHSRARFWASVGDTAKIEPAYPDAKLWQEIIFLTNYAKCKWVIENVKPYYEPFLLPDAEIGRHLFWSNFTIRTHNISFDDADIRNMCGGADSFGFNLKNKQIKHRKDQILRNLVNPDLGLYILEQALGVIRQQKTNQISIF